MVVDDSRSFCAGLAKILEDKVQKVNAFTSVQDALASLKDSTPDIIITDLEMPDVDGFDFVIRLRGLPALNEVPILVLTGKETTDITCKAIEAGADAFAGKSTVKETLISHLIALARLRETYQNATQGKQLAAVKALIGMYKHEFGNGLAAIDGKVRKLERTFPELGADESIKAIKNWLGRFTETLSKLDQLSQYEEEKYVDNSVILKVG